MASIIYPSFGNALTQGLQARALTEDANQRQRRRGLGPEVQAAIGGDTDALGRVAAADPEYALRIGPLIERLDDNKRQVLQRAADFTTRAGMGILNAPPEQRAAAFDAARAEAQRMGIPTDNWPTQWGPQAEGWLQFNVNKARPVASYFAERERRATEAANTPQPIGTAGGAPSVAPAGNERMMPFRQAIAGNESAGQPNGGYGAVGPETGKGRAYGKYQVMDFNIGPWTQEVLGRALTPQEFLNNPQAQDAVFDAKFGGYMQKYGSPEAAARAWFAGEGGMNDPGRRDVLGTTVADYGRRFTAGLGPQVAQAGGQPVVPQGGGEGAPQTQQPQGGPQTVLQGLQLPPGAKVMGIKGVPVVQGGTVMVQMSDGSIDFVPLPARPKAGAAGGAGGPFAGTSVEAQALNMLVANGTLTPHQAAELAAGKTVTNPVDGTVLFMTPSGIFGQRPGQPAGPIVGGSPQTVPAAPSVTVPAQPPGGAPSTALPGMIPITRPKKPEALKKLETEIRSVNAAIDNFQKVITEAGGGSFDAYINNPRSPEAQKVIGAFNAMKTALRSEAFVNTGVLQPAEMKMLDNMLLSPETLRGAAASPEAYAAMLDQIRTYIQNKFEAAQVAYGQAPEPQAAPQAEQPKASAGGVVDRERTRFDLKKKYGLE